MRQKLKRSSARGRASGMVLAIVLGCASGRTEGFLRAKSQGDRAYSSGRYHEAAGAYEEASHRATRPRDRAEALYLQGCAYRRGRSWQEARDAFARLAQELPDSERAERASFDLADLELDAGETERGYELLHNAILKHPNDGLARRALERYLGWLEQKGGDVLGWLRDFTPRVASTELDETARYLLATRIEATTDLQRARDAFVACAERHPYPDGALFDDALWHASLLDEKLGRAEDAIGDLRRMLAVREPSTFAGSYERPRFSPAQFRIAVLYRDLLADHRSARMEFHRLYEAHKSSTLRDDALWEEAKLAREDRDADGACALAAKIANEFPESRYAPCVGEICTSAAPAGARCHPYLLRP